MKALIHTPAVLLECIKYVRRSKGEIQRSSKGCFTHYIFSIDLINHPENPKILKIVIKSTVNIFSVDIKSTINFHKSAERRYQLALLI